MARQQARREATRTQILQAAAALFVAPGYAAATVDQIAEQAAVAKGTIYYHFKSKEEMIAALAADAVQQESARSLEALAAGTPPTYVLWRLLIAAARWAELYPHPVYLTALRPLLAQVLSAGQAGGHIRMDMPTAELASMLCGLYSQAVEGWRTDPGGQSLERRLERGLQIFLEGAVGRPRD